MRADGTPVLLDFGAARRGDGQEPLADRHRQGRLLAARAVPADGRLQGPWSDLYALGGTLYRAVTGKRPEEATLRVADDRTPPAAAAAGRYRPGFLAAIDACLKVGTERPQSVAELRAMMLRQAHDHATRGCAGHAEDRRAGTGAGQAALDVRSRPLPL